jgi:dephospho-CoA kinase
MAVSLLVLLSSLISPALTLLSLTYATSLLLTRLLRWQFTGLTGGIATGKSSASSYVSSYPISLAVIDLDALAHTLTASPSSSLSRSLVRSFGTADRQRIARLVFSDPAARRKLNALYRVPLAIALLQSVLRLWFRGQGDIVLDAPLLFESGLHRICRQVVCVACSDGKQLQRLRQRDGLSEEEARRRINSQLPLDLKRRRSDVCIENDGDLDELHIKLREWARWRRQQQPDISTLQSVTPSLPSVVLTLLAWPIIAVPYALNRWLYA